jgi:hypothetical protein
MKFKEILYKMFASKQTESQEKLFHNIQVPAKNSSKLICSILKELNLKKGNIIIYDFFNTCDDDPPNIGLLISIRDNEMSSQINMIEFNSNGQIRKKTKVVYLIDAIVKL